MAASAISVIFPSLKSLILYLKRPLTKMASTNNANSWRICNIQKPKKTDFRLKRFLIEMAANSNSW